MKTIILKTILLLFIAVLTNCTSSNNSEDQLPNITQIGANTFGCVVDGRVFVPKTSYTFTPGGSERKGLKVQVGENFHNSNGDDKWLIKASNYKDSPEVYIYIYVPSLKNNKTNHIVNESDGIETSNLSSAHIYSLIDLGNHQYLSFNNSGTITFSRLDINNDIYSGTFSVQLKNKDDENDIIEITDGRFDINLNTVNN